MTFGSRLVWSKIAWAARVQLRCRQRMPFDCIGEGGSPVHWWPLSRPCRIVALPPPRHPLHPRSPCITTLASGIVARLQYALHLLCRGLCRLLGRDRFQRAFDTYCGVCIMALYFLYLMVVKGALSVFDCSKVLHIVVTFAPPCPMVARACARVTVGAATLRALAPTILAHGGRTVVSVPPPPAGICNCPWAAEAIQSCSCVPSRCNWFVCSCVVALQNESGVRILDADPSIQCDEVRGRGHAVVIVCAAAHIHCG